MTFTQELTIGVIAVAVALLGLYDVVIAALKGRPSTISWVISSISTKVPFVPFAFGVLMGHLFAQDTNPSI